LIRDGQTLLPAFPPEKNAQSVFDQDRGKKNDEDAREREHEGEDAEAFRKGHGM
jgi:hypothetical protein